MHVFRSRGLCNATLFGASNPVLSQNRGQVAHRKVLKNRFIPLNPAYPAGHLPSYAVRRLQVGLQHEPDVRRFSPNERHLVKLRMMKLYHFMQHLNAGGGNVLVTGGDGAQRFLFKALHAMLRESSDNVFWLKVFWRIFLRLDQHANAWADGNQHQHLRPERFIDENSHYDYLLLLSNDIDAPDMELIGRAFFRRMTGSTPSMHRLLLLVHLLHRMRLENGVGSQ